MTKTPSEEGVLLSSGGRIRTYDLWVMSPASYRAAPPRDAVLRTKCSVQRGLTVHLRGGVAKLSLLAQAKEISSCR